MEKYYKPTLYLAGGLALSLASYYLLRDVIALPTLQPVCDKQMLLKVIQKANADFEVIYSHYFRVVFRLNNDSMKQLLSRQAQEYTYKTLQDECSEYSQLASKGRLAASLEHYMNV